MALQIFLGLVLIFGVLHSVSSDLEEIPLSGPGSENLSVFYDISDYERYAMIMFYVVSKTGGYISLGFSNKTGMNETDLFIGWVDDEDGDVYYGVCNMNYLFLKNSCNLS